MNRLNHILTAILFALSAQARANFPVPIEVKSSFVRNINSEVTYFHDPDNKTSIRDVLANSLPWQQPTSSNVMFGLKSSTTWIKFDLANDSDQIMVTHLELNPVFLEEVALYDHKGAVLGLSGSTRPNPQFEAFPAVQIDSPPGTHRYYLEIKSRASAVSLILRSHDEYQKKTRFDLAMFCALVGGLMTLLIYHFFLFRTYRNKIYLHYSLFIAATMLFTVAFTSYHRALLPSVLLGFRVDFWWSAISAPLLFLAMTRFSHSLLNLRARLDSSLKWRRPVSAALYCLPATQIIALIWVFATDDPHALILIRLSALAHILILPNLALYLWLRNGRNVIDAYYALSWLPFAAGAFMIVAWLSGAIAHHDIFSWSSPIGAIIQSTLLSFVAGQQLNIITHEKLAEQQAKLRVMGELETQVANLERRDRVISSFVSLDIVEELAQGKDPLQFAPHNVEKCVVFLDMHGYTTFSESHSTHELHSVINEYFTIINDMTYAAGGQVNKIIGDAMMIVFDEPESCREAILNLRKQLSAMNRLRVERGSQPLKFGVGISYGTMLAANFGSAHKLDRTMIGDTVNVASRLETITRMFNVDVLCSKEFVDLQPDYRFFRPAAYVLLKGKTKKSLVYELFGHNLPEVVEWKEFTKPYILEVIDLELNGQYVEAIRIIASLVRRCPRHTYKKGQIMDMTLNSMIQAIEEKMRLQGHEVPNWEALSDSKHFNNIRIAS